jgi:hypothetical protein
MILRDELGSADYDLLRKAWTSGDPADTWPGEEEEERSPMTPLQERAVVQMLRRKGTPS